MALPCGCYVLLRIIIDDTRVIRNTASFIVTDDVFLPVIFAADPEDDWKSPDTWHKAHPGLGVEAAEVSVMDYLNLDTLPEAPPVTAAMLMLIGALYENRESVTDKPVSESVLFTRLLAPYRKLAL